MWLDSKYYKNIENLCKENNWTCYNNQNIPNTIKDKYIKYISDLNIPKRTKDITDINLNKFYKIYISPDESLFFITFSECKCLEYNYQNKLIEYTYTISILTFGNPKQQISQEQNINDELEQIKTKNKIIKKFKQFINIKQFYPYTYNITYHLDSNNYPYAIINSYICTLTKSNATLFKRDSLKTFTRCNNTEPDSITEYITSICPYIRIYIKDNPDNTNTTYLMYIKLTDEGKKKFDLIK